MDMPTKGTVIVHAKIENLGDLFKVWDGTLKPDQIRCAEITNATVDVTTLRLALPRGIIKHLGLIRSRIRRVPTESGHKEVEVYWPVRLTLQGRDCEVEVVEGPDESTVVIGRDSLMMLDFVLDPSGQRLIGNPEHGGEHMIDMFLGELA
jgi:hypothetical protein